MEEVIENTDDVSEGLGLKFKLDEFFGPLDLLLQLIKDSKMSIQEIKLAEITEQFLEYISTMQQYDMENVADFLVVASKLLEIKSNSLLPVEKTDTDEDDDYIDPEVELKMQLEEYQLFKDAVQNLQPLENVDRFYKAPDKSSQDIRIVFNDFNYDKLLDAFAKVLSRAVDKENDLEPKKINKDRWTVAEKIAIIKSLLEENDELNFFSLFEDEYSKSEKITVFMSILELLKFQYITVIQNERYGDIILKKRKEETNDA